MFEPSRYIFEIDVTGLNVTLQDTTERFECIQLLSCHCPVCVKNILTFVSQNCNYCNTSYTQQSSCYANIDVYGRKPQLTDIITIFCLSSPHNPKE